MAAGECALLQPGARDRLHAPPVARNAPVSELRPTAALKLRFTSHRGQSALTGVEQQPPWKVVRAFPHHPDGTLLVHLGNVSGGILAGDRLHARFELGEACRALITTTSCTRIYRARHPTNTARQSISIDIARDALLEYLPDAIIPFANSRFVQHTRISLADDAGLFAWEIIAPGRSNELFAFSLLHLRTQLTANGVPFFADSSRLIPQHTSAQHLTRLGRYTHQAMLLVCRAGLSPERWRASERDMAELAHELPPETQCWGVSTLPQHGLIFRGLATDACYLQESLIRFWSCLKKELYAVEAVLPRKLY